MSCKLWLLIILLAFPLSVMTEVFSDASSGFRAFGISPQEGLSNDLFVLGRLEFIHPADVMAKIKVKNVGKEEASFALSVALFDADKNLLTVCLFAPHFLRPADEEYATLEFPGSGEVFPRIKYYQVSMLKRQER
ncbi:MAG TPA: hypothetical protein ACFYED_05995 [Candidatus Tripitaka californicus]